MAIRVVTEDAPIIRITGVASAPVSSPIGAVNTVNVSQSNQIVKVPSTSAASIEIKPIGSAEVQVNNPIVRPFKAIIYQGPKGDPGEPGVSGDGSSFLTEELTVTNPVGEAEDGQVYAQLTDLEDIIRDMLTVNLEPNPAVSGVSFGRIVSGEFVEYENHGYKFEIGDPLVFDSVSLTSSDMALMYPNSNLTIEYTAADGSFQTANPQIVMPTGGWLDFPVETTVNVNQGGLTTNINLPYTTLGRKVIRTRYFWYDGTLAEAEVANREFDFFIGKKIRCFTSVAADPQASNISSLLNNTTNVFNPENDILLSGVLQVDSNQDQYVEVLTDFTTETQEIIISFNSSLSQSVSDKNRYLIIEIPDEFKIDEVAATTAGSGIYSLNDSIVYLGNQFQSGDPYTRNNIPVKYYRSKIPGAFDEKIKIDLQIKLDN